MREGMDRFWQMKRTKNVGSPLQSGEAGRGKRKFFSFSQAICSP